MNPSQCNQSRSYYLTFTEIIEQIVTTESNKIELCNFSQDVKGDI